MLTAPVKLELFGVDNSYQFQMIRQMLTEGMESDGIEYELEEVTDIDRFIEAKLESIPSIRISGNKVFSVSDYEQPEEIVGVVMSHIHSELMGTLVVPLDFSPISRNAARYAVELAPRFGLKVEIVHVYHPVVDPHNAIVVDPELGEQFRKNLNEFANELQSTSGEDLNGARVINSRYTVGYPLPTLVDIASEPEVELLVMGTLGATNILDDVFGNISSSVATQTDKPLILVPPDSVFTAPRNIMVAFGSELVENGALGQLLTFNKPFKAHIDFVHISDEDDKDYESLREQLMSVLLNNGSTDFSFDIRQIAPDGNDVAETIIRTADNIEPDILTLIPRHRSFIQRLFHTSVTRKLCLHGNRPMLIVHP